MADKTLPQDIVGKKELSKAKKQKIPDFFEPMLATLTKDYFNHKSWIYERRLDGERATRLLQG